MLMTAVVHPDAFDPTHFLVSGYRDQAELLFRGIESNGLLLIDPDGLLLKELNSRVQGLSTKNGQQLQIRLAELQKKMGRRVLRAHPSRCPCAPSLPVSDLVLAVHNKCRSDTVVARNDLQSSLKGASDLTPLEDYLSSSFENTRHRYMEQVPPIDLMPPGEFDAHMARCTRFSKTLRFYDKQIGHGSSIGGFRQGIGRIVDAWIGQCHFDTSCLSVEIYTCAQRTHKADTVVHAAIRDDLARRLARHFGIQFTLYLKVDQASLTHDRFLQSDSLAVSFSKGFDYENSNGSLQRCVVKVDNTASGHLQEYRSLPDHFPPTT